jgi:hypothetical protein
MSLLKTIGKPGRKRGWQRQNRVTRIVLFSYPRPASQYFPLQLENVEADPKKFQRGTMREKLWTFVCCSEVSDNLPATAPREGTSNGRLGVHNSLRWEQESQSQDASGTSWEPSKDMVLCSRTLARHQQSHRDDRRTRVILLQDSGHTQVALDHSCIHHPHARYQPSQRH